MPDTAQNIKRRNHEVPRGLLKNWLGQNEAAEGYHYWDFSDFKRKFETGRAAKFAIVDYLYVPNAADGKRSDALEDWFSIDENGLSILAVTAQSGQRQNVKEKHLIQGLRAAVALGFRSAYQFYLIAEYFNAAASDKATHFDLVRNAYKTIHAKFSKFLNWNFMVLYSLQSDLLICDRPLFDWTLRPKPVDMITMPLGPSALLVGTPDVDRNRRHAEMTWHEASANAKLAELQNVFTIETARHWIVARTPEILDTKALELSSEKLEARRKLDRLVELNVGNQ